MKKLKLTTLLLALILISTSFKQKEITWTAIGDSITYLNDHLDETGNRLTKGVALLMLQLNSRIFITSTRGITAGPPPALQKRSIVWAYKSRMCTPFSSALMIGGMVSRWVK